AKKKIQTLIHWDLIVTAIFLAFLSGGLASRGGAFLERWSAGDSDQRLRIGLLVGAVLAGTAAILIYRKEVPSIPRKIALFAVLLLTLVTAVVAGAWIGRDDGSGP